MQLSTTEWGDPAGQPIVCLHGVSGHGRRFRRLAEERLRKYRVVGVDYRGRASAVQDFGRKSGAERQVEARVVVLGASAMDSARILLNSNGSARTMLDVIQEKNKAQGKTPATRSDLRLSLGPDNQVFLLNKGDGTIRVLTP